MEKRTKVLYKAGSILAVILFLVITSVFINGSAFAQGQETCPQGGDWIKKDGLSGTSFTYTAPAGKLIAETCYKASTEVIFNTIDPPQASVTVVSTVGHDLSHASFRLVDESTPTPTEPTPTEPTPTEPTPTEPTPTEPTPTEPTPTEPTPTIEVASLILSGICNEGASITWSVSNSNKYDIAFSWTANNGQSGSGVVSANGSANFSTRSDGFSVSLEYAEKINPQELQLAIEVCKPKDETPVPTEEITEQPPEEAVAKVDPQPDEPAGGSGPSFVSIIAPIGILMLVTASGIVAAKQIKIRINQ